MKITNKTLFWFITVVIPLVLQAVSYFKMSVTDGQPNGFMLIFFGILIVEASAFIIWLMIFLINLYDDDIKFEFTIPNPFKTKETENDKLLQRIGEAEVRGNKGELERLLRVYDLHQENQK